MGQEKNETSLPPFHTNMAASIFIQGSSTPVLENVFQKDPSAHCHHSKWYRLP